MAVTMSFSDDTNAVVIGLAILGFTSFTLAFTCAFIMIFTGYLANEKDTVLKKIPPMCWMMPAEENLKVGPEAEKPRAMERAQNCHRNHTENSVMLACWYIIYLTVQPDSTTGRVCIYISSIARILYGICYLANLSPWRTISFMTAAFAGAVVAVIGLAELAADDAGEI